MKKPTPTKNDCFAMTQGPNWPQVDEALSNFRLASKCWAGTDTLSTVPAAG